MRNSQYCLDHSHLASPHHAWWSLLKFRPKSLLKVKSMHTSLVDELRSSRSTSQGHFFLLRDLPQTSVSQGLSFNPLAQKLFV